MKKLLLTSAILSITACSQDLLTQPKINRDIYTLSDTQVKPAEKASEFNLIIEKPEVAAGLDTTQIASIKNNQIVYKENAKWADGLGAVVESTIAESFENSKFFKSVSTEDNGVYGNYAVALQIRDFQVDGDKAKVKISTKLIKLPEREVVLNLVTSKEAASSNVAGLDKAFNAAQQEIVGKVVEVLGK